VSENSFSATLDAGEAVLRFPYDERLRQTLRAIPGRRWDPLERAWCVPLDPEGAEALARLLGGLRGEARVSEALARAIARRRARRRRGECVLDLARPDENWWLSFATDGSPELVERLLAHPDARRLQIIGRALIPLDEEAARLVSELRAGGAGLQLTDAARRALSARTRDPAQEQPTPRTRSPVRAVGWHGNVDVTGPSAQPVFLLLGDVALLPGALRERAASAPGGAAVPLSLESWTLIKGQLRGWVS
jgi:hypothetical protein